MKAFANGDSGTSAAVLINVQSAPTDILAQTDYTLTTDYLLSSYQWHKIGVGPIIGADSHQIEITQNIL